MTRDEFLAQYRGSVWAGGPRYWRGEIWYLPLWTIVDLEWREIRGFWTTPAPKAWFVTIERIDDNSRSEPRGFRKSVSLQNCFQGFGPAPDLAWLTLMELAREGAPSVAD